MPPIHVRRASAADRPMVERLWLMFRHDMSEFSGQLPNPDGTFRAERHRARPSQRRDERELSSMRCAGWPRRRS